MATKAPSSSCNRVQDRSNKAEHSTYYLEEQAQMELLRYPTCREMQRLVAVCAGHGASWPHSARQQAERQTTALWVSTLLRHGLPQLNHDANRSDLGQSHMLHLDGACT